MRHVLESGSFQEDSCLASHRLNIWFGVDQKLKNCVLQLQNPPSPPKAKILGEKIWVFPKIRVPQNGWFIMENPIEMDDLGVPLFLETSIYYYMWVFALPSKMQFFSSSTSSEVNDGILPGVRDTWWAEILRKHLRLLGHSWFTF